MIRKNDFFYVHHESCDTMLTVLQNFACKKAAQQGGIPVRIIKEIEFVFSQFLFPMFNFYIDNNTFPNELKEADTNPVYKKDDLFEKANYMPISILPILSKAFEHCLCDQIYEYIGNISFKAQCSLRKGLSRQYSLITMIEKWRKNMDKGGSYAALVTDLSKAFDCIVHDFLITNLKTCCFSY